MSKIKNYKEYLITTFRNDIYYILHITKQTKDHLYYDDYYYYNNNNECVRVIQQESIYKISNIITQIKTDFDTLENAKESIEIIQNMKKYNL